MVNFLGSRIMSAAIESAPPVLAATATVSCDGDGLSHAASPGNPRGHPRVYLKIGDAGEVVCPYCSRRFILAEDAEAASGHSGH